MSQIWKLFIIGLRQIIRDGMLLALLPAPIMIGISFKFLIPFVNNILQESLHFSLTPWYGLIDGLLICLVPMMTAIIFAFLLLEERDEGIGMFYRITPTGRYSYLIARICIPMLWSFVMTLLSTVLFNLTYLSPLRIFLSSFLSSFMGVTLSLMIVSMAKNRVEGLAISKLMSMSLLGLFATRFLSAAYQLFVAFLPSYWIGRIIIGDAFVLEFIIGIVVCALWGALFLRKFMNQFI